MRILLVGRQGQLAWELRRTLLPLGEVLAPLRGELDLSRPESIAPAVRACAPQVIVNAAAYTAVDQAESEQELAMRVNGLAPGVLAAEAACLGALLLHYSTDYVFDGCKEGAYLEDDAPAPLNAYGASKLHGERAVSGAGCDHLVLRTSWVYAARGKNFVRTIARLAREREQLRIVADQFGAPTWARYIAEASALVVARAQAERAAGQFDSGVFHLAAAGATSWHGFAEAIVAGLRRADPGAIRAREIVPIPAAEYPLPARRPANSRLDCGKIGRRFGVRAAPWNEGLELCLEEMLACEGGTP